MKGRTELFFSLLRTNRRGGGSAAALRGTSLCCVNGCWAFIWQCLTHGRRCTWMSHNSKPDGLNSTARAAGAERERNGSELFILYEGRGRAGVFQSSRLPRSLLPLLPFSLPLLAVMHTETGI